MEAKSTPNIKDSSFYESWKASLHPSLLPFLETVVKNAEMTASLDGRKDVGAQDVVEAIQKMQMKAMQINVE